MTVHAVPAWQLQIGWNVVAEQGGPPRRLTGIRLEGVPSTAVAQFASGQIEHYPAARPCSSRTIRADPQREPPVAVADVVDGSGDDTGEQFGAAGHHAPWFGGW